MTTSTEKPSPNIDYHALGDRLRAYRLGASLMAEDVAEQLGVSRAVVYRLEKGEIVKIDTLERLARLLNTSLASLLGVEVEYYSTVLGLMERMRQLEQNSSRIVSHFEPFSLLLTSDNYLHHLRQMLTEAAPRHPGQRARAVDIERMIKILQERKAFFEKHRPNLVSLVGLRNLVRFVRVGLVGHLELPQHVRLKRVDAAREEVMRIVEVMENEPLHIQIGIVDDAMPMSTFQVFSGQHHAFLAVSPFRFGELPNVRNGIATVTSSPEALRMYDEMIGRLWKTAYKGKSGAQQLRKLLDRTR
jgi:transcriptional regulator with XRE-family HTH domain